MALHGEIKANHEVIAHWQARRTTALHGVDDEYVYECEYVAVGVAGADWLGEIRHRYSAGAASLAAKVLLAATLNGVANG